MYENPTPNKYIEFIKKNKYIIFACTLIIVLLLIVVIITSIITKAATTVTPSPTPNITQPTSTQTSPTLTSDGETETIKFQAKPQIDQVVDLPYTISKVKTYEDAWAVLAINNPATDPANVILKKENGNWRVILGPGTFFEEEELINLGVPPNVAQEANSTL